MQLSSSSYRTCCNCWEPKGHHFRHDVTTILYKWNYGDSFEIIFVVLRKPCLYGHCYVDVWRDCADCNILSKNKEETLLLLSKNQHDKAWITNFWLFLFCSNYEWLDYFWTENFALYCCTIASKVKSNDRISLLAVCALIIVFSARKWLWLKQIERNIKI